ncbi:MAG TPA: sugar transferase [Nocardioides sp.]|nr:sugar transferase [Nocardioides sp.]
MTAVLGHATAVERPVRPASSRSLPRLPLAIFGVDALLVVVATSFASVVADGMPFFAPDAPVDVSTRVAAPLIALGWLVALAIGGSYRTQVLGGGSNEYKRVFNSSILTVGGVAVGCFLSEAAISRGFFVALFTAGLPLLLAGRWSVRKGLHAARRAGYLGFPVLIAGAPEHIDEMVGLIQRSTWLGFDVVGALTPDGSAPVTPGGVPVVGSTADTTKAAIDADAHVVLFTDGSSTAGHELRDRIWDLEERGIGVVVAPGVTGIVSDRVSIQPVSGLPLMHLGTPAWAEATRVGKRIFDILGASALLFVLAPVMLFVALRIKLHDGGPVFFHQSRVGRQGIPFRCAKFRTMVIDAEERLAELHAATGYQGDGLFKLAEDPRITKPGTWLRRFSIDELPQLLNVVRGDMSLVGPRPPLPIEVARYDNAARRRLHVRPGMTGLWQVSGRSDLSWDDAVRLDLYYVDNWSMLQDLHILFRTFGAVVRPKGAY